MSVTAPKIVYTDQLARTNGVKALVYGRAGTGKTTLCATAPNPFIISAESGLLSLRHVRVPAVEVSTVEEVLNVWRWLQTPAAAQIQTVCLDSLSEIGEKVLTSEKKGSKDGRMVYGNTNDRVIEMAKSFRDLPGKNVLFTAKEGVETNPVTGVSRIGPDAPGKSIGPALTYLFDEVFRAEVGRDPNGATFHYLRCKPDAVSDAKDRSGRLDEIEYNPNLARLFGKIMS